MPAPLNLRSLRDDEAEELRTLAHGRKVEARLRDRAHICWLAHQGRRVAAISATLGVGHRTVRRWIHRFNAEGLAGLTDAPRRGRPPTYTPEQVGTVVVTSLTPPQELGLPFGSWTLDRLVAYLQEEHGIAMRRSRMGELLHAEGLRWRTQETWFGERVDPAFAEKRGRSSRSTPSRRRPAS
jgi:transposase